MLDNASMVILNTDQLKQIADILRGNPAYADLLLAVEHEQSEQVEAARRLTWPDSISKVSLEELNQAYVRLVSEAAAQLAEAANRQLRRSDYADAKPLVMAVIRLRRLASEYMAAMQRRQIPLEWQDE